MNLRFWRHMPMSVLGRFLCSPPKENAPPKPLYTRCQSRCKREYSLPLLPPSRNFFLVRENADPRTAPAFAFPRLVHYSDKIFSLDIDPLKSISFKIFKGMKKLDFLVRKKIFFKNFLKKKGWKKLNFLWLEKNFFSKKRDEKSGAILNFFIFFCHFLREVRGITTVPLEKFSHFFSFR